MDEKALMQKCLDTWGQESQLSMLQEECAELIVAVSKVLRGKTNAWQNLYEEIADVSLMIDQIKLIAPVASEKIINEVRKVKLERLENILKDKE